MKHFILIAALFASVNSFANFRFGVDQGKATVDGYSIKDCSLFLHQKFDIKTKSYLEDTLSKKGYRPIYVNGLFQQGLSIRGFKKISELPETHKNDRLSGRAFLVFSEDGQEIKTTMKVFGEDGFELGVSFRGNDLNSKYLPSVSVDELPECKSR
jgi:hypothetical protein